MPKDYEPIDDTANSSNYNADADADADDNDFPSMLMKLCARINIKVAIFIFILGLFIFSDVFIKNILAGFRDGISSMNCPTTYGTILQLLFLTFGYIFIDLLVQGNYI